jgi:hypothetical protein
MLLNSPAIWSFTEQVKNNVPIEIASDFLIYRLESIFGATHLFLEQATNQQHKHSKTSLSRNCNRRVLERMDLGRFK